MNKVYVDWETFGIMIDKLADKINETHKGTFDGIYGVPRGGLPIATALSHRLGLPLLLYPNRKSLICDDISDTGKTLQSHQNKFIATLHSTEWTMTDPDCFVEMKKKKTDWIVYPWENK